MNRKRLMLMAIAVVAVGVFALPSTVSLFSGQHAWYDVSHWQEGTHTTVPCKKCHADVYEEMNTIGPHTELEYPMYCEDCHRIFYNYSASSVGSLPVYPKYTYASGNGSAATPGVEAHAASTIECMDCHGLTGCNDHKSELKPNYYGEPCGRCHYKGDTDPEYAFIAGGFNLTKGIPVQGDWNFDPAVNDTGEHAAHKNFVLDAMDNPKMEGANEACIGCHTSIPVKITWTHARSLEFNATYESELVLPPTHFNTSNYTANGTVTVTSYGNWSGGANTSGWPEGNVTIWGS
jgi:hypothetical protein